jgi:hypothetical protein
MAASIRLRRVAALETMDAQNLYPLLNNYLFACQAAAGRTEIPGPADAPRPPSALLEFPDAGLIKVSRPSYELIVGASKGGVLKLFDRRTGRLVYSDCGFVGRLSTGQLIASQALDRCRWPRVTDDRIVIEAPFYAVKRTVFRPLTFLVFRLVNLTLGRLPRVDYWIKSLLVRVLVYRRRPVALKLRRTIVPGDDGIEVQDRLQASRSLELESLVRADVFSTIHMGSSRYFQPNELNLASAASPECDRVPVERLREGVELRRVVRLPEL